MPEQSSGDRPREMSVQIFGDFDGKCSSESVGRVLGTFLVGVSVDNSGVSLRRVLGILFVRDLDEASSRAG